MYERLIEELQKGIEPDRAEHIALYFGIAVGCYGEDDKVLGIRVPYIREVCRDYKAMPHDDIIKLLRSPMHEFRFAALVILQYRYNKDPRGTVEIYLDNIDYINNWDLVDVFAPCILGRWCLDNHAESILFKLNSKSSLWRRRISLVAYLAFYRKGVMGNSLDLIDLRLEDPEDLMQKACGWMLREIYSKVDKHVVESYIRDNYHRMSRTTLRYAIEHMSEDKRQKYLKGEF